MQKTSVSELDGHAKPKEISSPSVTFFEVVCGDRSFWCMTTNKGDPPRLVRIRTWLEGAKERHKDPRQSTDGPDGRSSMRTGSSDNGDDTPAGSRESHEVKEKNHSQKTTSTTKSTTVGRKSHILRSSLMRDIEFIRLMTTHGPKHLEFDKFLEMANFLVHYSDQKERMIVRGTIVCAKEDLRQALQSASNRMQSRSCKDKITPVADPLESKWSALKESVSKLSKVILNEDNDSDQEEDTGREYRPKNVDIAVALLPVFKATCGSVYPLPTVRTSCDGSVRFTWTNRQTLSAVTCSIRFEEKGYEVDLSKYIVHKDAVFEFFPFSVDDQANKESIGKVLSAFLSDVFSA